jgi:flagellum-specific ATP synthase
MTVLDRVREAVEATPLIRTYGRIVQVVGLVVESDGPHSRIGDLCVIEGADGERIDAEVVGFKGARVLLMPLGELSGIRAGCLVRSTGHCLRVEVGEHLLGQVLDGMGRPLTPPPTPSHLPGARGSRKHYPIYSTPPDVLSRKLIDQPMSTGIRAIDGLLTLAEGQRMGIFAGSGVGKSTLLGMIARTSEADVNVIALVGERGREVREFIEHDLGEVGLKKSVIVVATSDQPALVRIKAALVATAIAEYFRDEGKRVMLMMDSVTRFCTAQREVGLAIGEPPSTKGFTPSVFAMLPRLMERAGTSDKGSITGLYTVLVEGDDTSEPVADAARSILDGHIVLSRDLANKGHFPAIDVLQSLSRTMPLVTDEGHRQSANRLRELLAAYRNAEDLISIGAYKEGAKPIVDQAIARIDGINQFLKQPKTEAERDTKTRLHEVIS